jgi:hypothetical protein
MPPSNAFHITLFILEEQGLFSAQGSPGSPKKDVD